MRQSTIPRKPLEQRYFCRRRCPGLGQTYSERPARGLAFLAAGVGLIAAGGFNLDRAVNYNDLSNRFNTGFYDPNSGDFLTADQGRVKARGHAQFGVLFLASGIGVYLWNIFDAAKTVDQYNERRFPVQAQQNMQDEFRTKAFLLQVTAICLMEKPI